MITVKLSDILLLLPFFLTSLMMAQRKESNVKGEKSTTMQIDDKDFLGDARWVTIFVIGNEYFSSSSQAKRETTAKQRLQLLLLFPQLHTTCSL